MFAQHRPKAGVSLRDATETEREPRHPQSRLDVGRIGVDNTPKQRQRVGVPPGAGEIHGAASFGRRRLKSAEDRQCRDQWQEDLDTPTSSRKLLSTEEVEHEILVGNDGDDRSSLATSN
jgi:hypothetical protein